MRISTVLLITLVILTVLVLPIANGNTQLSLETEIQFSANYSDENGDITIICSDHYSINFKTKLTNVLSVLQSSCNHAVTLGLSDETTSSITGNKIRVTVGLIFTFDENINAQGKSACISAIQTKLSASGSYSDGLQTLIQLDGTPGQLCRTLRMRPPGGISISSLPKWRCPPGYEYDSASALCRSTGDRLFSDDPGGYPDGGGEYVDHFSATVLSGRCNDTVDTCLDRVRRLARSCPKHIDRRYASIVLDCTDKNKKNRNSCTTEEELAYLKRKMEDAMREVVSYCSPSTNPGPTTTPAPTPSPTTTTTSTPAASTTTTTSSHPITSASTLLISLISSTISQSHSVTSKLSTTVTSPQPTTEPTTTPQATAVTTSQKLPTTAADVITTSKLPHTSSSSIGVTTIWATSPSSSSSSSSSTSSSSSSSSSQVTAISLPVTSQTTASSSPDTTTAAISMTTASSSAQPTTITTTATTAASTTAEETTVETTMSTEPTTVAMATVTETSPSTTAVVQKEFGIEVLTTSLSVEEGSSFTFLEFNITTPPSELCQGNPECRFEVIAAISNCHGCNYTDNVEAVVGKGTHFHPDDFCVTDIKETDWQETRRIPIYARLDGKLDGNQTRVVNLIMQKWNRSNWNVQRILKSVELDIRNNDLPAMCSSVGDPHITTFDGREFNNYYQGEFVLYRHTELPFEVHVVLQACSQNVSASCNCAVYVRAGDDVIVIDQCRKRGKKFTLFEVDLYLNNELTPGTYIYQQDEGRKIAVHLPYRAVVRVSSLGDFLNVNIEPSASDRSSTLGLCGVYDGIAANDLTMPNNTVYSITAPPTAKRIQPVDYLKTWRVEVDGPDGYSQGVPKDDDRYKLQKYCSCRQDTEGKLVSNCADNLYVSKKGLFEGKDITNDLVNNAKKFKQKSRRRKRQVEVNKIDVNPNFIPPKFTWPTESGLTKAEAEAYCKQEIEESTIGKLCKNVPNVNFDNEVKSCMDDIQITDNKAWAGSALEALKAQCLQLLKQSTKLDPNLANNILGAMCPRECSKQGSCKAGKCVCRAPYSGADCSVNTGDPPNAVQIKDNGICNVNTDTCNKTRIYGNNFVSSNELACHLVPWKLSYKHENEIPKQETVPAKYINFNTVECPIPKKMRYNVTVTNGGNKYSKHYVYVPYDPVCYDCQMSTGVCYPKTDSCMINSVCLRSSYVNPSDSCQICNPTESNTEWSRKGDKACEPTPAPTFPLSTREKIIIGSAGGILALVLIIVIIKVRCFCRRSSPRPTPSERSRPNTYRSSGPPIRFTDFDMGPVRRPSHASHASSRFPDEHPANGFSLNYYHHSTYIPDDDEESTRANNMAAGAGAGAAAAAHPSDESSSDGLVHRDTYNRTIRSRMSVLNRSVDEQFYLEFNMERERRPSSHSTHHSAARTPESLTHDVFF